MAKSQQSYRKRENEKKKQQKQRDKAQRREERKLSAEEPKSFEDMIAYVDENGNVSSTPPDPVKKKTVKEADIELGSRNAGGADHDDGKRGKVTFHNVEKGFGFIRHGKWGEDIFFHNSSVNFEIKENDEVTFDMQRGPKGLIAVNIQKSSKTDSP